MILSVLNPTVSARKVDVSSTYGAGRAICPPYLALCAAVLMTGLTATSAHAADVPSGQSVTLHEVLIDSVGNETWLRFRFVAPQMTKATDYASAEADMEHLCTETALPYMRDFSLEGQMVVISLSDRETEFGVPDPDATQVFEAYRPVDNTCIWEGL